jgi:ligand-binding sensor domain-containing protein/DNA-binding CsgD family transcriptional regulator
MKNLIVAIVSCSFLLHFAFGQSTIGLPAIRNYTNIDYHASIEIWDIHQDKRGLLYFANDDGLLTFDGAYWKIYTLPNKAAIKSLAIDDSGRIYVGGQDEVGYFYPDSHGILTYHSLKELLPTVARQFADIWNILIMRDAVYFRTIESIFQLKNNKMQTFDAPGGWRMTAQAGRRLWAEDRSRGLLVFRDGQWEEACRNISTAPLHITGILDYNKDTLLVTTLKNGLYLLAGSTLIKKTTAIDRLLTNDLVTGAQKINDNQFALATNAGGLLIISNNGTLVQHFSAAEGLQNNNVLAILVDQDEDLWLGLQNGTAFIHYNTSVTHISPVRGTQIMSNAVRVFDHQLFIGTSNGLYSTPLDPSHKDIATGDGVFSEVANTRGQVWSVEDIDNELLMGHQDGAFVIRDNEAIPVITRQGVWGFSALNGSSDIVAGTYTGLRHILYKDGNFIEGGKVNDLYESLPVIAMEDHSAIWASHPYRGVFKTPAPADPDIITHYTNYTHKDGLPSDLNNFVCAIGGKILVATGKGVYEYNAASDRFIPSAFFQPIFKDTSVEYLKADQAGRIWFISNQRVGVIDIRKPSGTIPYSVIYFPELTARIVKGAGYIYPYDDENIFIGSNNGVFHVNYSQYIRSGSDITVLLGAVKAIAEKDSLIFGGYFSGDTHETLRFPNHWNSFHLEYSSPLYARQANVEFSYRLTGFDKEWSEWSPRTEKDYTNLPYGEYTFSVRARNNLGNTAQPVSYSFVVRPAWYQTVWAWLLYLLLVICVFIAIRKRQQQRLALHQKRHEEEQERLTYLHSLELDRKEKGMIALQNAKLEGELQFKNKELATVTMHLVERGGLLSSIKEELLAVIKKVDVPNLANQFKSVFKMISDTEKNDDDWNRFALYFDQVHNDFLAILKTKFPQLSPTDLKLCAYLRLNLSSKEIAQLLNISLKGVEVSRYRIRKKLSLPTEVNLYDFLVEATNPRHL